MRNRKYLKNELWFKIIIYHKFLIYMIVGTVNYVIIVLMEVLDISENILYSTIYITILYLYLYIIFLSIF